MRLLRICWILVQITFALLALALFILFCPHGRR